MVVVGKTFEFSACHQLMREDWSAEKNLAVFGKCANPNGHGHNYTLEVTVGGQIKEANGMIMDTIVLSQIVEELVIQHLDHKNLNLDVPWLKNKFTSSENIVNAIWERLEAPIANIDGNSLYEIKLWETKRIYAIRRAL